jgi:hypothetical protein
MNPILITDYNVVNAAVSDNLDSYIVHLSKSDKHIYIYAQKFTKQR